MLEQQRSDTLTSHLGGSIGQTLLGHQGPARKECAKQKETPSEDLSHS